jgi:hypothetical protein
MLQKKIPAPLLPAEKRDGAEGPYHRNLMGEPKSCNTFRGYCNSTYFCTFLFTGRKSTKIMKICALVLTLAFAVSGQEIEDSDTWARLQIGQEVFTTLHYGDLEVKVYEQLRKPNATKKETKPWYYFMPVNLLLPQSAECIFNKFTDKIELRFSIEFWNDDLRQRIVEHLLDSEGIANAKVAVIPFEQVILITTESSHFYRPTNSWVPYRGQKLMKFSLICVSES